MKTFIFAVVLVGCANPTPYTMIPPPMADAAFDSGSPDASAEAAAVDAGPPDRSSCTAQPDVLGLTVRMFPKAPKYSVYVPKTYDPNKPSALIEVLHGAGDNTPNYIKLWEPVADQRNLIILAPEASVAYANGYTWGNDTTFIVGELDDLAKCYSIDSKRRVLHGFSAGGVMAYWIGLGNASLFSGIIIFSADYGSAEYYAGKSLLPAAWKIPVSHWHGMDDMNFPISSGLDSKKALEAAGHTFYWHPVPGGHTAPATIPNALQGYDDLASSVAP